MKSVYLLLLLALLTLTAPRAQGQGCSMCKTQTNSGEDGRLTKYRGQGINTGILYLAAVPYIAGGLLGLMWYRNRKRLKAEAALKVAAKAALGGAR